MRRALFIFVFCLFIALQISCGQTQVVENANKADGPKPEKKADYPSLKVQAQEMQQAVLSGDFAKAADYFNPKLVERAGGKEKMAAGIKNEMAQMKAEGFEIVAVSAGNATQIERIDNELFAVLPVSTTMKTADKKAVGESSLVGISSDGGLNWTFIDGVNQERFKMIFPKAAEKIHIPEEQLPKTIETY
jgi:limonene-1,2-epoxide hydrolase